MDNITVQKISASKKPTHRTDLVASYDRARFAPWQYSFSRCHTAQINLKGEKRGLGRGIPSLRGPGALLTIGAFETDHGFDGKQKSPDGDDGAVLRSPLKCAWNAARFDCFALNTTGRR